MTISLSYNFEIAPGYRVSDWRNLKLEDTNIVDEDWKKAISIFEKRIRSRFIEPAGLLIDFEKDEQRGRNGFVILAIDFLLIETIQGFRRGCISHRNQSENLFRQFLTSWPVFKKCVPDGRAIKNAASDVYKQGRCALHHTGSTDSILVKRIGPTFKFMNDRKIAINRTRLHTGLTEEFQTYLGALSAPENDDLRQKFRLKMHHLCI